jgi:uncharacterized protein
MGPWTWLIPLGFVVGAYGTLIGAGGGFVLVPVLLLVYPHESPALLTSISLAVVFCNATSGSVAYARMKRIDYRLGLLFAAASVPGAVLGALVSGHIPRRLFNAIFGVMLSALSVWLLVRPRTEPPGYEVAPAPGTRTILDSNGIRYTFAFRRRVGVLLSVFVGFLSSLLGIGGGIIHVPALVQLLNFPAHIATATSHFVLAFMALAGTGAHVAAGSFSHGGVLRTLFLGLGAVVGAQVGAAISTRIQDVWILRGLALALAFVGIRILWMAF